MPFAHRSLVAIVVLFGSIRIAHADTPTEARAALDRAIAFFHGQAAFHGGYVYRYSGDLTLREAEGLADEDCIWVQPPGTPSVGEAFLDAYDATDEPRFLAAARDAAAALLAGQKQSGGWYYSIEFAPESRRTQDYRAPGTPIPPVNAKADEGWHVWRTRRFKGNGMVLDDDVTTAALRFLMRLDRTLKFEDAPLRESIAYALESVRRAQYPNGAWSHNYDRFPGRNPSVERYPVLAATYPRDAPRTWPKAYAGCYNLNDAVTPNAIGTMLDAWRIYGDERFLTAAKQGGDFLLLARMPTPQPAWAQQYDERMHPVWDRPFEPPAISGRESQTVLETLLRLAEETDEMRFLEPIPTAVAYLKKSQLDDGQLARFYELETNRPIYFSRTRDRGHEITYDRDEATTGYGYVVENRLPEIERRLALLRIGKPTAPMVEPPGENEVKEIIAALDDRGAWVEPGGRLTEHRVNPPSGVIHSQTFVDDVRKLSRYLAMQRPPR